MFEWTWVRDPTISANSYRRLLKKRTCSLDTSAFSALEVLDDNRALQIHLLTYYLLTYFIDQFIWYRNVDEISNAVCTEAKM